MGNDVEEADISAEATQMRRGKFRIEVYDPELFSGWTDGELWNGWATPLFEYAEAVRITDVHNKMVPLDPNDKGKAWYEAEKDRFCFITEGTDQQTENYPAFVRHVDGEIRPLYGIGTWYWTWEEYEEVIPG